MFNQLQLELMISQEIFHNWNINLEFGTHYTRRLQCLGTYVDFSLSLCVYNSYMNCSFQKNKALYSILVYITNFKKVLIFYKI